MEPFLGQIQFFGFNFAPRGWAFCDGQVLPITQNQSLFSLLGTMFGGDGRTTFKLPDLRGRVAVGFGQGPGLDSLDIGASGGATEHTLSSNELPPHTHKGRIVLAAGIGNTTDGNGQHLANNSLLDKIYTDALPTTEALATDSVQVTGGGSGQAFTLQAPYLSVSVAIAITGLFPSRN